jgi:pyruvate,water dikinase
MHTLSTVALDRLSAADEPRAGAKAANCARLRQAGFPVPDGLVLLSTATAADAEAIAADAWFDRQPAQTTYAVRSSGIGEDGAGHSFAGIHRTALSVLRADLAAAVALCRASAHSREALAYRDAKTLPAASIMFGVLIQPMIEAVAAGVAFTVNPVTGAQDEIVINSSWGVGEALVSGQVDPDEFVVNKRELTLAWERIGQKDGRERHATPSLAQADIRELVTIATAIERHFGSAQDIEWCHDGARFWIVQSRPITTATPEKHSTEWTRANLAEVLPDLTSPQALAAFENLLNRAERHYMGALMAPEAGLGPTVKSFAGRLYFNLSQLKQVCAAGGMPPAVMLKSLGHPEAIQPDDERAAPLGFATLRHIPAFVRLAWKHVTVARVIGRHNALVARLLKEYGAVDARALDDRELWSLVDKWIEDAPAQMEPVLLLGGVTIRELPLRKICERIGMPFEQFLYPQLAAGERSVSAQQAFDLAALATTAQREGAINAQPFLAQFDAFIEAYGHRGRYESDWSLPRYREDPSPILAAIAAHGRDGCGRYRPANGGQLDRDAEAAWQAFAQRLSRWQRWTLLPRVQRTVRTIKRYYVWREQVRSDMMKVLGIVRQWHLQLANRFVQRGWLAAEDDYFLLTLPEIGAVIRGEQSPTTFATIVTRRAKEREEYRKLRMPLLMRESELPRLLRSAGVSDRDRDDTELTGQPVSSGIVEAEVVVLHDPADFARMKRGAIIVAPATDPSWTPLFTLASGVIVEVGGVLSHASTIAREYGLPAVANVRHATRRLKTGDRVRLDAIYGRVHKLPALIPGAAGAVSQVRRER